jgi:hypothetical protein
LDAVEVVSLSPATTTTTGESSLMGLVFDAIAIAIAIAQLFSFSIEIELLQYPKA